MKQLILTLAFLPALSLGAARPRHALAIDLSAKEKNR